MKKFLPSILLFFAGTLFFGIYSLLGIDLHHDGIMFKTACDAANGFALFRESFSQYGVLTPLLQGAALKVFGVELVVLKLLTALFYGASLVVYDNIWKRFFKPEEKWWRFFAVALFFLLSPDSCVTSHPWASVYALFFLLLAMEFTLRFFENSKRELCFALLAGVCGGLMFGFRQPCGLTAVISAAALCVIIFAIDRRRAVRYGAGFLAGFSAVAALLAVIITIYGAWRDYIIQTWSHALTFAVKRGAGSGYSDTMNNFFPFITGDRGFIDSVFAFMPLVTLFLLAWLILNKKYKDELPLVSVILFALGAWHQYYPVPCMRHLFWAGVPMFGIFVYVLKALWQKRSFSTRSAVAVLAVILFFAVGFRCFFGVKRLESIAKRQRVNIPGVRGLLLFNHEAQITGWVYSLKNELPPELLKRGVFNHTPDGVWSIMLPSCTFTHPLYCRIGETIYPDYDSKAFRYCMEKRPAVISSLWKQLPGYVTLQIMSYNGVDYALLVPVR